MRGQGSVHRLSVAHLKTPYSPVPETFIDGYISHMRRYVPFVVTCRAVNLELSQAREVLVRPGPTRLDYLIMRFSIPLLARQLPFERFRLKVLRARKPSLVHAHFGLEGIYLLPLRSRIGAPIITSFYGHDLSSLPRQRPFRSLFVNNTIFDSLDQFVAEGTAARRALIDLGCPPEKVAIVHIGADLNRFPFIERRLKPDELVRLLFCGRFEEKKGLLYGIRALASLRDCGISFQFRVIGYGTQEHAARTLVSQLGLTDQVVFLGGMDHDRFRDELLRAHILLAPSVTDLATGETEGGAPTVLIEAQATGMPVVSSRHADIPGVVRDGETGLLADERDIEGIATCLLRLIEHPERWPIMGQAGRAHIEQHYSIVTETARLEALYDRVIADWPGKRW